MKKYSLLLGLGIAIITTNSCAMMQMIRKIVKSSHPTFATFDNSKILITKKSAEKLQTIRQDYQSIANFITNKSKELSHYKKPSDLINELSKDKSIHVKYMTPGIIFFQEDIKFLNQQFEKMSAQYNTDYAWSNILFLMHTKLENTCDDLKDCELIHNAAMVSLKQEQRLDDYNDTVPFNISHWKKEDKDSMIEAIKRHKNIISKE